MRKQSTYRPSRLQHALRLTSPQLVVVACKLRVYPLYGVDPNMPRIVVFFPGKCALAMNEK
jgi:hypothetical protein